MSERLLWQCLRNSNLGCKFSRQMPVGPYFADCLCRERGLIIEIDGHGHDHSLDHDIARDNYCRCQGYEILRFSHADVMENLEGVVLHIRATLAQPHPQPLPPAGGE